MRKILMLTFFAGLVSCGVQDSSEQEDGISDSDHRIFVTGAVFNGAMGGLAGADTLCKQAAEGAGLTRQYRAILSNSTDDAEKRLNITGGVYMFTNSSTRTLIAASGIDLWGTNIDPLKNEINRSEQYAIITDSVWTGTGNEGGQIAGNTCNDWTLTSGTGFYGNPNQVNSDWVEDTPENCTNTNHLYCISTAN